MTRFKTQLCWKSGKTLQHCWVEQNCWWQCLIKSKIHPTLDRTKNVGRTSFNMGDQTVDQCWIERSWCVELIQLCFDSLARALSVFFVQKRTPIKDQRNCIQLFRESLSRIKCTRQSRKVIWDMINTLFLTTVAVEPTFVTFLQHSQTYISGLPYDSFKFL